MLNVLLRHNSFILHIFPYSAFQTVISLQGLTCSPLVSIVWSKLKGGTEGSIQLHTLSFVCVLIRDLVLCKRKSQFPLGLNQNAWQDLSPLPRIPAPPDTFSWCVCSLACVQTHLSFHKPLDYLCDCLWVCTCTCCTVMAFHWPSVSIQKTLRKKNMLQSHAL